MVSLLHRIFGDDLDAFDYDPFGRLALFAHTVPGYRRVTNLGQNVIAFDQFAERRVFVIETRNAPQTNEELRTGRVRIVFTRHRKDAADMREIVEFSLYFVARSAFAITAFFCRIFGVRVTTLDHEALDDPVKDGAVVKTFPGKL